MITNVFNVLANGGFLRDQGVLSLESVQEFYNIIDEEPLPATMRAMDVLDFCYQHEYKKPNYRPVITLTNKSSKTGKTQGHAVVLNDFELYEDCLVLKTIDSASKDGKRIVECPIMTCNRQQTLLIGKEVDKWCLGSEKCYFICFN